MNTIVLSIPEFKIIKVTDDNFKIIYYELYINDQFEGRYDRISSVNWRISQLITEASLEV